MLKSLIGMLIGFIVLGLTALVSGKNLGAGDVNTLANAIIVAFDTTVVGIGAGAVAYFVSKVRRRWYEEDLSNLDALCDALLDKLKH